MTDHAGTYICHLERAKTKGFRRLQFRRDIDEPGVGSLEYHIDNELVGAHDDLFAYGYLVWFKYRGKTFTWIVEDRSTVLDRSEHATDWVKVSGPGTLAFVGDRTIWPTHYSDVNSDPSLWEFGGWSTKSTGVAALAQKVVPVASTTAGAGATVGDPVEIVGGGHRQIGIIASIVAGTSITLEDELAYTFPTGSRVRSAARQWRRFVNRAAGEMLWDNIAESNGRFTADTGQAPIVRGIVQTTGADGWTQDFRFDNQLDVLKAVTNVYGDVEMDGLTFNYYNAIGTDRTADVILQEGRDLVELRVDDSDRGSLSWIVAEGTGHAVFSYLAPKKKLTRAQRKTAAKRRKEHRKAPAAPRKVIQVKADYLVDLASEAQALTRRREAFLDAKDVSDPVQLDAMADAALEEHQIDEAVGIEALEERFKVDIDYGMGDWVRAIAPSRGFDEDIRIVAITIAEDDAEIVRALIDVNTKRQDRLIRLAQGAKDTRSSLGVQNRQPQGQLVPFSFSGQGIFDIDDTMETHFFIPDRMYVTLEARVAIDFRPFFAAARSAVSSGSLTSDSGGGSTSGASSASSSGASSASTSDDEGLHKHNVIAYVADAAGPAPTRKYGVGGSTNFVYFEGPAANLDSGFGDPHHHGMAHNHGIAHNHTTPNHQHTVPGHTHALVFGTQKEAYPASHSVTLRVYELVSGAWTLRLTLTGLTNDQEDLDLISAITGPGQWRIDLLSEGGQPNNGRLAAYVSGHVLGAIQSA